MKGRESWGADFLREVGMELDFRPYDPADSDDPEELRRELELQRIAAQVERRGRTERAVILQVGQQPDGNALCIICTPTGDRAQEHDLVETAATHAAALRFIGLAFTKAAEQWRNAVASGDLTPHDAWAKVEQALLVMGLAPESEPETTSDDPEPS